MTPMNPFDFSIHHLRFSVEAATPILMDEYKGSALRGAWHTYMQQAYCGAPPVARNDPLHQAMCPVCYLTNREIGAETRRPYALQPPLSRQLRYEAGEAFEFGFTLFGNAHTLFPYVLLAVREVGGSYGIGGWIPAQGGRGRYRLLSVEAVDPHSQASQTLYRADGGSMVQSPTVVVTASSIEGHRQSLQAALTRPDGKLTLTFLTPMRLIHHEHLMHWFSFSFFFQRLLERLYALAEQFSPTPESYQRPALIADGQRLLPLAEQVQVVANRTEWWDVKGYSQRKQGVTYIGGLIGSVDLVSQHWPALLPYVLWGQSTQLGKNVVKGGGLYQVGVDM